MTGPVGGYRNVWLGEPEPRERRSECCARCRRGVKGFGELPCGYPNGCPNPKCDHSAAYKAATEGQQQ